MRAGRAKIALEQCRRGNRYRRLLPSVRGKRDTLAGWEYSTKVFLAAKCRSSFIGAGRTLVVS